jgi:hypothetical protein
MLENNGLSETLHRNENLLPLFQSMLTRTSSNTVGRMTK